MQLLCSICLFIAVMLSTVTADAGEIPTSARAREAIGRIRPSLEKRLQDNGIQWGAPVFVRIFKTQNRLQVWLHDGRRFKLFETFDVCTYGGQGLGPKTIVGDRRAPEGFYYVTPRQLNPYSSFHLAFNLGYPNVYDRAHGRTGSALMVHGDCVSVGCFAMTDEGIEKIYALADAALRNGQSFFRVHIFPFPMTDRSMARYCRPGAVSDVRSSAQQEKFWEDLKIGYDYFERHRRPPNVRVKNKRYVFLEDK